MDKKQKHILLFLELRDAETFKTPPGGGGGGGGGMSLMVLFCSDVSSLPFVLPST